MAITVADILAMRDALEAGKGRRKLTPAQVVQGLRTQVHEFLQREKPFPYPLPEADDGKARADYREGMLAAADMSDADAREKEFRRLHHEEVLHLVARKARMFAQVTSEDQIAFQVARAVRQAVGIRDAHHYAQYLHGKALWEEADRLVSEALNR